MKCINEIVYVDMQKAFIVAAVQSNPLKSQAIGVQL